MVSYTFSKSIDIGCSGWFGVEGCSVQDPYHFNNDRSVSGFDVTQVLAVNWLYELPIGKGKPLDFGNSVANYILGNWQLNGITVLRSGAPYTTIVSGDVANTGNTGYERSPGGQSGSGSSEFRPVARSFCLCCPGAVHFRLLGAVHFSIRLVQEWWDLSIFRQFPIRESTSFEFRAEAFNVFNVTVYSPPVVDFNSPNFGRVLTMANSPRQLQLGAKIIF